MPDRFFTGVSRPTATACWASAASEDAMGSLVKWMYGSAALSTFCFSQKRSATSWVLPSEGVASDLPLSWAALVMPFLTTSEAPPAAAPEMILIAVPLDFCHALIAGLGPT